MVFIAVFIMMVAIGAALIAVSAGVLWALLLLLASLTGWPVAISFWACAVIVTILGLFIRK